MIKASIGVIVGFLLWFAAATLGNLLVRALIPSYHAAEALMAFTLPMLLARLAVGAFSSVVAGFACSFIAGPARKAVYVLALIMLVFFLPVHYRLLAKFPLVSPGVSRRSAADHDRRSIAWPVIESRRCTPTVRCGRDDAHTAHRTRGDICAPPVVLSSPVADAHSVAPRAGRVAQQDLHAQIAGELRGTGNATDAAPGHAQQDECRLQVVTESPRRGWCVVRRLTEALSA
jgi:hypothetical protein